VKNGKVRFKHPIMRLEGPTERTICVFRLGQHHNSARFDIKAMYDTRPAFRTDTGHRRARCHENVGKRPPFMSGSGMDDNPRGLIDDNDVFILENHIDPGNARRTM
jgi:hypothetical protein